MTDQDKPKLHLVLGNYMWAHWFMVSLLLTIGIALIIIQVAIDKQFQIFMTIFSITFITLGIYCIIDYIIMKKKLSKKNKSR